MLTLYVQELFPGSENIKNFGEKILFQSIKSKFIHIYLFLFIDFHLNHIKSILSSYDVYLSIPEKSAAKIQKDAITFHQTSAWPNNLELLLSYMKIDEKKYYTNLSKTQTLDKKMINPNIVLFQEMCEKILDRKKVGEEMYKKFDQEILEYLYEIIWENKERIMGIHNRFGEMAFKGENVPDLFFLSENEKVEVIQNVISVLEKIHIQINGEREK